MEQSPCIPLVVAYALEPRTEEGAARESRNPLDNWNLVTQLHPRFPDTAPRGTRARREIKRGRSSSSNMANRPPSISPTFCGAQSTSFLLVRSATQPARGTRLLCQCLPLLSNLAPPPRICDWKCLQEEKRESISKAVQEQSTIKREEPTMFCQMDIMGSVGRRFTR